MINLWSSFLVANGSLKKQRKNPNDPARFVNKVAVTNEGEKAKIHYYLDTDKIAEEEKYLYYNLIFDSWLVNKVPQSL